MHLQKVTNIEAVNEKKIYLLLLLLLLRRQQRKNIRLRSWFSIAPSGEINFRDWRKNLKNFFVKVSFLLVFFVVVSVVVVDGAIVVIVIVVVDDVVGVVE